MNVATGRVLDRLPAEEPCLGGFFTSYGFDPAFFEDHVLRAVLRLTSDPVEQAARYHDEAQHAIQETPIVAVVDAGERRPGRRLPYDLLEVSKVVFHPKSALLLYGEFARLLIGSGNLTAPGYGGNTELFMCTDLRYAEPSDAAILKAFDAHIERARALVRHAGSQLDLFRDELQRRIGSAAAAKRPGSLAFLDSTTGPILDQFVALLPEGAEIESIGLLAPFYERDDVEGGGEEAAEPDTGSVFGALAGLAGKDTVLDVGVSWDNAQMRPTTDSELEQGLFEIWTRAFERDGRRCVEHLVPTAIGRTALTFTDDAGQTKRWRLAEVRKHIEKRNFWRQPKPVIFAPRHTLTSASGHFDVRVWLHPTTRLVEGRPVHRPLHAKMLTVAYRSGGARRTLVLMGSPNMSRRALLKKAAPGLGNVEVALAFCVNASLSLRHFLPELVHAPEAAFDLKERDFPELGANHALAVEQAIYDPESGVLRVTWAPEAAKLPAWRLAYDDEVYAGSDEPPEAPFEVSDFQLKPSTAELVLYTDGREYSVPILVTDLVALPVGPGVPPAGLSELLMLLGRRTGTERLRETLKRKKEKGHQPDDVDDPVEEALSSTDVFRAWWSVADDLRDQRVSVNALRLRLEGALGVGAAWAGVLGAMQNKRIDPEEAWFYGAELLRELCSVPLPPSNDQEAKRVVLEKFCERIRKDLDEIGLESSERRWMKRVSSFYSGVAR